MIRDTFPGEFIPAYWDDNGYWILDQLLLPGETRFFLAESYKDVEDSISNMVLRGAPLIGAAASAGMALSVKEWKSVSKDEFDKYYNVFMATRPTAVNLRNVLDEIRSFFNFSCLGDDSATVYEKFRNLSVDFHKRDIERNISMGEYGADYIEKLFGGKKLNILTHCNAGALATAGYGTALGVIRSLNKRGLVDHVWVDETRPYLQGSRLTAYEMVEEKIPHTLITDNTAAFLMQKGFIDMAVVGADRMALNGDFANKIGTYSIAVNSARHNIPFFTALPFETFDTNIKTGAEITIEERNGGEVTMINGKMIAPSDTPVLHLGFDVTPAELLAGVITEYGVIDAEISEAKISTFIDNISGGNVSVRKLHF